MKHQNSKKIKIVIDARVMSDNPSGIGMYLYNFLKEMIKYEHLDITLLTDALKSNEINFFIDKVKIINYDKNLKKTAKVFSYFKFIKREVEKINPDYFWEINAIMPIKMNFNGKFITTIHDVFPLTEKKYYGFKYRIYFKTFLKKTLRHTDIILFNSRNSKEETNKYFKINKKTKTIVLYVPLEIKNEKNNIDDNFFLYLGNNEERKGFKLLLSAYKEYRSLGGEKKLFIAGKIVGKERQEKIEGVKYLGYVNDKEKQDLYRRCSCFVFPSYAEGFGIPPLEAMMYNKPVIVSNLKIFDEILKMKKNIFDISSNDKTLNLANALNTYKKYNGYEKILQKYDVVTLTNKLIKLLDRNIK